MTDKTIDHRLAWLAGIIDGEGWIGFNVRTKFQRGRNYEYAAWYVAIANTDPTMLCEVASIADTLAARYSYQLHDKQQGNRKEQQRITFAGKADVKLVLEAVLPYLINKRAQAELTLRALHRRYAGDLEHLLYRSGSHAQRMAPIDSEFRQMVTDIRKLNQRGLQEG